MVLRFFRRKPKAAQGPLAAYDLVLERLERQNAELRRAATTLLTVKRSLEREHSALVGRDAELVRREDEATTANDGAALRVLQKDRAHCRDGLARTAAELERVADDARLLLEGAERGQRQFDELKAERVGAMARLSAGRAVSEALAAQVAELDRVLVLEAARDDVERAHALAEIYREDSGAKR